MDLKSILKLDLIEFVCINLLLLICGNEQVRCSVCFKTISTGQQGEDIGWPFRRPRACGVCPEPCWALRGNQPEPVELLPLRGVGGPVHGAPPSSAARLHNRPDCAHRAARGEARRPERSLAAPWRPPAVRAEQQPLRPAGGP